MKIRRFFKRIKYYADLIVMTFGFCPECGKHTVNKTRIGSMVCSFCQKRI